ncbi:MAG: PocR ligand-binding domain-containing protein [Clostridiales bacterium]|nr:PocR ligand-binding domain-containing protein [Clostridiales bacterium]
MGERQVAIPMLNEDDFQRLGRLLNHLFLCTGVKFSLMDEQGRELYTSSFQAPFCRLIMQEQAGLERCLRCDRRAAEVVRKSRASMEYVCHAGLYEVALPVVERGETVATILFGQMIDEAPREEQWKRVSRCCSWYPDMEALHQAFLSLRRISSQQMTACREVALACVSEARLQGLQATNRRNDALVLQNYVDTHYMQPMDSDRLSRVLNVGKTKLYALCREHFQLTPMQMVARRRIAAAKELLLSTSESIRAIAGMVGIPDENYFTKVFKVHTGVTPRDFRKGSAPGQPPAEMGENPVNPSFDKEPKI